MRKLVLAMMFCFLSVSAFALDITGTWSVKAEVMLSSCKDEPMLRINREQWIINQTNNGYRVQVIGHKDSGLVYEASMVDDALIGRYKGTGLRFSDFAIGFKSSSEVGGVRVYVEKYESCQSTYKMSLKKLD